MSDQRRPPNVVLFCCDHLRWDWLGCAGHPLVMTPQIDKLADQGVLFSRTYSECPVCIPARRILMTGMDPYGINMQSYVEHQPFPEGPKLAEVLRDTGYQTMAAGKLHTYPQRARIGFEEVQLNEEGRRLDGLRSDDYEQYLSDHGMSHRAFSHGLGNNQYGMRLSPLPEPLTTTGWTGQRAMELLERRDPTRPFFLYVSFDKPHPPITPPLEYYELYRDADFPRPGAADWEPEKLPLDQAANARVHHTRDLMRHPLAWQQIQRGFAAMITHIDSTIGTILGQLRESGDLDNTHILLTSDHGDLLFDHGATQKSSFFGGSARVPLLITPAPAYQRRHAVTPGTPDTATPAGLQDIMPTILDLCALPCPSNCTGQSLVPRLRDRGAPFRVFTCGRINRTCFITDGRYSLLRYPDDGITLLFDIENDPGELHDCASDPRLRDRRERMERALAAWLDQNNDPLLQAAPRERDEHDQRLQWAHTHNCWNNRGRH